MCFLHFYAKATSIFCLIGDAQYAELYIAAMQGQCEAIEWHRDIISQRITAQGETALHIAALAKQRRFVEELTNKLSREDLETGNINENIALCYAAAAGDINIAKVMINKNRNLANISRGLKPVYLAALSRQKGMLDYLTKETRITEWTEDQQIRLLTTCIENGLYGELSLVPLTIYLSFNFYSFSLTDSQI